MLEAFPSHRHLWMARLLVALFLLLFLCAGYAKTIRSSAAKAEFKRQNPCPANGNRRGSCPGYQIDHIVPLCAAGADTKENMQWLSIEAHKAKTKEDRRYCRVN